MKWTKQTLTYLAATVVVIGFMLFSAQYTPTGTPLAVSYSELVKLVKSDQITRVVFEGDRITATLAKPIERDTPEGSATKIETTMPPLADTTLLPLLEDKNIVVTAKAATTNGLGDWMVRFLPWILILGFYFWILNRQQGGMTGGPGGRDFAGFLEGSARKEEEDAPKVTFADVAGQDSAKQEVAELVDFLRNPEEYRKLGAEPPKGVLLMGPPGTGKTLLARALAGEAGVNFFHISASEFIEMFVGVGASRVRKMFDEAKKRAPSIIFIDELDSVGRVRGTGLGGGNDEREQTLNQILSELDGFSGREAVVVLAATNRPDVLDPALLRPGRFDRHVTLELPDKTAREAILRVHTRHVPLDADVDLGVIAAGTPGFSGADLKNLVNEAALAATRSKASAVSAAHLDEMRDKVMMGSVRTLAIQPEEKHRLAVHEAGHTIVAFFLPQADPLYKVTIIPRGRSLGGTHMLPEVERHTLPEDYLRDRLSVLLAGRAAEREVLGGLSSGADDDIHQATLLSRAMVARWGMSEDIGPIDLRQSDEHPFLGREIAQPRSFSEKTAQDVDVAVRDLLKLSEERAIAIIQSHRDGIDRLVEQLEKKESLDRSEIDAALDHRGEGFVSASNEDAAA